MTPIDGPRIAARSGKARQLVVFLHGYGADGNDLIDIGRSWQGALPDATFVSPHAPEPCAGSPYGRQWFGLTFRVRNERWNGVNAAHPTLTAFLDTELTRHGVGPESLALVGFSQGTMMALHTGLRRAAAPAALIGYSGILITPEDQPATAMRADVTSRPPVFLAHGDEDTVIPPEALAYSAEGLSSLNIAVSTHMSKGIGHGIDGDGLNLGGAFLAKAFAV